MADPEILKGEGGNVSAPSSFITNAHIMNYARFIWGKAIHWTNWRGQ